MLRALEYREIYAKYIEEYDAQIYIKGNTDLVKKNVLFRYAPDFFYLNKKSDNSFVESIVKVHYASPNYFTKEIRALNGNRLNAEDILDRVMQFLNVNIYYPTIFNEQILMPEAKTVFKYYQFEYEALLDTLDRKIHKIKIIPKIKSQKLISGYFYIVDDIWTVYQMDIRGRWELSDFRVETEFGLPHENFLLPIKTNVTLFFNLLGNQTINYYFAQFEYPFVKIYDWNEDDKKILSYDVSDYFSIEKDSLPIIKDSLFWKKNRPIPLSDYEESLYETEFRIQREADSIAAIKTNKLSWNYFRGIFIPQKYEYNQTRLTYSGLLNPFKLSYSKMDGIVYWQQFRLMKEFDNKYIFEFKPDLGLVFKREDIYFRTPMSWTFAPDKFGSVYFNFENNNQSFNSNIINKINEIIPDSINFDDFNIEYYRHYHMELASLYELTNGLILYGGLYYDWYNPIKEEKEILDFQEDPIDTDVVDLVDDQYRAFAPVIGLGWTPKQYYRFIGNRKEYVGSRFPTFSVEYARGIKNIFDSNSNYERIEIDVQQKIPVGLMRSFHYYFSVGWFTKTTSVYFADFKKFRKRNVPESWDDPLGGVFHLLRSDWYNASNSYVQAHFMYECPFALLQLFKGVTRDVLKERVYLSQLYTPVLPCYTEVGYSIGNFLGNAGIFMSLNKGKIESLGAKVTFDLR